MAESSSKVSPEFVALANDAAKGPLASFDAKTGEGTSEKLMDAIEMIGEEQAAGFQPQPSQVTAGMRYLHCSRTIHQLVTDRNRAVGIYLAVASLLVTACSALLNAKPAGSLIIPIETIQRWCLPVTFGILTVLAMLIDFLLIRTRVGLIYEAAKMNALLGLPLGRVQRNSPLSIFFIMQSIISLAGGTAAALFCIFMIPWAEPDQAYSAWISVGIGALFTIVLMVLYVGTVNATTSDARLQQLDGK